MKVPFIQTVYRFDKRWLEYDGDPNEIPTRDKKYIWVDTYARWRITDPLLFYQGVRDERSAQSRLDDIVDGETRNAIASFDLIEVVRSRNRPFARPGELGGIGDAEAVAKIATGREKIAQRILERAAKITPEFGIELVDVRFRRVNYTESVQQAVFQRMIAERKRIAERSRSEGQGRAAEIRGQKERDCWPRARWATSRPRSSRARPTRRPPRSTRAPTAATPASTSSGSRWRRCRRPSTRTPRSSSPPTRSC